MNRVISYIDGFNLYFGLKSKGWNKYYWLDLAGMSSALLKQGQSLQHCHYFTARIRNSGGASRDAIRQSIWLDALDTLADQTSHYGHYLRKRRTCRHCGAQWTTHEEKMTDVNIAVQLLSDASGSCREGVSRTCKGHDGYAPMPAYLGQEGYCLEFELREGKQHCQKGTPALLERLLERARQVTDLLLLLRLDGGNDAIEHIDVILEHNAASWKAGGPVCARVKTTSLSYMLITAPWSSFTVSSRVTWR